MPSKRTNLCKDCRFVQLKNEVITKGKYSENWIVYHCRVTNETRKAGVKSCIHYQFEDHSMGKMTGEK